MIIEYSKNVSESVGRPLLFKYENLQMSFENTL